MKPYSFGRGIYSTLDPAEAEKYAKVFDWGGKSYRVIFQNRFIMLKYSVWMHTWIHNVYYNVLYNVYYTLHNTGNSTISAG